MDPSEALRTQLIALYEPLRSFAGIIAPIGIAPDDLVHDAFMRVLERGGLDGIDQPLAYLRRVVTNLAIAEARRTNIDRRALARHGATSDAVAATYPSDLDELRRVDPRCRALLYLVEIEGAPIAEAAEILGISAGAARMQLSRARRQLRQFLEVPDAYSA